MTRRHHTMKMGGYGLIRGNHSESHTFFPGRFVFGNLPGSVLSQCLSNPSGATTGNPLTTGCGLPGGLRPAAIDSLQTVSLDLPQFYQQGFDNPVYTASRPFAAAYWQDSWAIRPNFTLNYGLRYELDVPYGNLNTHKDNFAPRVSFAWDPFKDHKTVVRAGYGIFYSPVYAQIPNVVQTLGIVNGFRQIAQVFVPLTGAVGIPPPPGVCPGNVLTSACIFQGLFAAAPNGGLIACTTPGAGNAACITAPNLAPFGITLTHTGRTPPLSVIFSGQPDNQNPYSQQAEFGIERAIGGGTSISVSGIYAHTLRLPVAIDVNNLPGAPLQSVLLANGKTVSFRQWGSGVCNVGLSNACFANRLLLQR